MAKKKTRVEYFFRFNIVEYYRLILILLFFGGGIISANAQDQEKKDSTNLVHKGFFQPLFNYAEKTVFQYLDKSSSQKAQKPFMVSVIGGPYYTNETKVGMGLIGSGLFRLRGCENDSLPSNVSLFANATTSGAYSFGFQSTLYFQGMNSWINVNISFSDTPSRYWGIGYDAGENAKYAEYNLQEAEFSIDYFRKIGKNLSAGVLFDARDMRGKYFKDLSVLNGEKRKTTAMGVGLNLTYDSRDVITDPYKGMYILVDNVFYPNYLGNAPSFNRVDFIFRYYKQLREGTILAFDFDSSLNFGDVPWNLMALSGGANQMRGYYNGRYRDKKLIDAQVELRQHIYKRSGMAVWVGGGNVFSEFDKLRIKETLPTVGFGYRFRVKERTNLRLDYGFGKGQSAFYININEAF